MANIFDKPTDQKYIETFIPRPLEEIGNMAKNWTDNFNKDLSKLEVSDPIAKLNPRATFKIYDTSAPGGERDISLDWNNQKNNYLQQLNAQKNKIVDDFMASGDEEAFKRNSRNYLNEASGVYNNFAQKEQVAKQIQDYNKELAKNPDYALKGHLGQKLKAYNTKFYQDAANGIEQDYAPSSVAKDTNRIAETSDYFKTIGKEVLSSYSNSDNTGYIKTHYREGVPVTKIEGLFNSWYQNSRVQDDIILEGLDVAAKNGIDTQARVIVKTPVSKDPKSGVITYKEQEMSWIQKYEEDAANEMLNVARGYKSSTGRDQTSADATFRWNKDKQDAEKLRQDNINNALRGFTFEGDTITNILAKNDENYKSLVDTGVIKETSTGLVLNTAAAYGESQVPTGEYKTVMRSDGFAHEQVRVPITRTVKSDEKAGQLANLLTKLGKAINYTKPIVKENWQDLLNKYNEYDKLKIYDQGMSKAVSTIESEKARRDWNMYEAYDVNDLTKPLVSESKPQLGKNDKLVINANKNTIGGKMFQTGYIEHPNDENGNVVPPTLIVVRSNDQFSNNYRDAMTSSATAAIGYESGQDQGKPRIVEGGTVVNKDGSKTVIPNNTLPGVSLKKIMIPGVGILETIGIIKDGKKTTQYILNPTDGKGNINAPAQIYNSQLEAFEALNLMYYGKTQSGKRDVSQLATDQTIYKETKKNDDSDEEDNWFQNTSDE